MLRLDEDDFHLGKFRDYEILDACNGYILFQFSQELQSILGFDCYTVLNFSCLPLLKGSRIGIPAFSMLAFDPPASPYYKVLLVFYPSAPSSNKPYEVPIFSSETRQWTCPTVDPEIGHSVTNFGPTICLNGLAYQRGVDRISDTGGGVRVLRRMSYCFMWREGVDPTPCGNTGTRREGGDLEAWVNQHELYIMSTMIDERTFRIWAPQDFCTSNNWILRHTLNLCPDNSPRILSFHPFS